MYECFIMDCTQFNPIKKLMPPLKNSIIEQTFKNNIIFYIFLLHNVIITMSLKKKTLVMSKEFF